MYKIAHSSLESL